VLVRSTMDLRRTVGGEATRVGVLEAPDFHLLGIWQGSWEGQAVFSKMFDQYRVPVGMGVTPIEKLLELLNTDALAAARKVDAEAVKALLASKPDSSAPAA